MRVGAQRARDRGEKQDGCEEARPGDSTGRPYVASRDECPATSCQRRSRQTSTSVRRWRRTTGVPSAAVVVVVATALNTATES